MTEYKIESIEKSKYNGRVYNIEVEDDNSYLTDSITVHNCKPSASHDILFDRDILDKMTILEPVKIINDFKIFKEYDVNSNYGSGHDVAEGVGLDSSTSVFINFSTVPAQVVATYKNNLVKPDMFGYVIERQSEMYGDNIVGIERNSAGHGTIAIAKLQNVNLYRTEKSPTKINDLKSTEYGWHTNQLTKPKMLFALMKAIEDGLLVLNDIDLINECKSYTRNDLMDKGVDVRLTTRHFDLLIACAIAWQMKNFVDVSNKVSCIKEPLMNY